MTQTYGTMARAGTSNRFAWRRAFAAEFALLALVVVGFLGSLVFANATIERLLERDATYQASRWAAKFATQFVENDAFVRTGSPTLAQYNFIEAATSAGDVFRMKLFAADGTLKLISDELGHRRDGLSLAEHNAPVMAAMEAGAVFVGIEDGRNKDNRPDYYAEAYAPVMKDGERVAIVEVYVDHTERHAMYRQALNGMLYLLAVIGLATLAHAFYTGWVLRKGRRSHQRARYLAKHDALTGVPNRTVFNERLTAVLEGRRASDASVAVLMIDLDGFKAVNDAHGHAVGDALLQEVSLRIGTVLRDQDVFARLGGDEFAVLQTGIQAPDQIARVARRIVAAVGAIDTIDGRPVRISASVGIALSGDLPTGAAPDELLKRADIALYTAKEEGRNRTIAFEPGMEGALRRRHALRERVRAAVETDGLEVHYQPQHDAGTARLTGFEALVRLPDGEGGCISPAVFIPVAEEMHLMERLGALVLQRALRDAQTWPNELTVAVNLSAQQFEGDVVEVVCDVLSQTGLAPERLELEITESLFIADAARVECQLRKLKAMGVRIAMDDFGTGYSSLSYLWQFPFDTLKIDRSCFQRLGEEGATIEDEEERSRIVAVLDTIGAMGRSIGLSVTAEGIETLDQWAYARRAGYHHVQGYLIGRPMPHEEVAAHILRDFAGHVAKLHEADGTPTLRSIAGGVG